MQSQKVEQVGGTHYNSSYEHWDLVAKHNIGYFEANASKYITRWRKKGGVEDLRKAKSYVQKRLTTLKAISKDDEMQFISTGWRGFNIQAREMIAFLAANCVGVMEQEILLLILDWNTEKDLHEAVRLIDKLIDSERDDAMPRSGYVDQ